MTNAAKTAQEGLTGTTSTDDQWIEVQVVSREQVAADVVELALASAADGPRLPGWKAGAHIDVELPNSTVRQYSLLGASTSDSWRIAVLREPAGRGGSCYIHDNVGLGTRLRVGHPRNMFPLAPSPKYLFIAGGIGITPITAMIEAVEEHGAQWSLVYGGRTRSSMAYRQCLQDKYGDRVSLLPEDETGLLDLPAILAGPRDDCLIYCCGPEALISAVERHVEDLGWSSDSLRIERFAPKAVRDGFSRPFDVELAQSDVVVHVRADQTLLEALEEAGVELPYSCSEGTCGTCETAVLSGEVDHRDSILSASERAANDTMMPCVSRSLGGRLVLDV